MEGLKLSIDSTSVLSPKKQNWKRDWKTVEEIRGTKQKRKY